MKSVSTFSRRAMLVLGLTGVLAGGVGSVSVRPAVAHEAKCPVCKLDVVQDTATQDNEVALKAGRKRIEYRCVYCAVADAKSYKSDITILAPSELKGKPVVISRKGDQWSMAPAGALFVAEKVNHRQCQAGYRAFTTKAAFDKWVQAHKAVVGEAKPVTLEQLVALGK